MYDNNCFSDMVRDRSFDEMTMPGKVPSGYTPYLNERRAMILKKMEQVDSEPFEQMAGTAKTVIPPIKYNEPNYLF